MKIGLAFSLGQEEHLKMIYMSLETFGGRCDSAISARLGFGRPADEPADQGRKRRVADAASRDTIDSFGDRRPR